MYTVKQRNNRASTFGEGRGTFSPHFSHPKRRILGGSRRAAAGGGGPGGALVGAGRRKKGRVGGGRAAAGPGHWPCRASPHGVTSQPCRVNACGATGPPTSAPAWPRIGSFRQRGGFVAPAEVARQRPSIAPVRMARPNGLHSENKIRKIKILLKKS